MIRYAKSRKEVLAVTDRVEGRRRLRLAYVRGSSVGLWPGEEYASMSEAWSQLSRMRFAYPGAVLDVVDECGRAVNFDGGAL